MIIFIFCLMEKQLFSLLIVVVGFASNLVLLLVVVGAGVDV